MGKGLGKLQRAILQNLDASRRDPRSYKGHGLPGLWWGDEEPGWVAVHGHWYRVAHTVYDMRQVVQYLARLTGTTYSIGFVKASFGVSCSRALRGLIARGYLILLREVPCIAYGDAKHCRCEKYEKLFTFYHSSREIRFVSKGKPLES